MAPVFFPPEQIESYTLDGTGVFLLSTPQRLARRLTVIVEKVKASPVVAYYNFRVPEPQGFWGYLQIVRRDFIESTIQLEYRRQVILSVDNFTLEPIEQIRCLIKESTLFLFDNLTPLLLAAGGDATAIGEDRAEYILNTSQPRLIPATPATGIYYEIAPGWLAQITLIWQDYAQPCGNPAGNQVIPPPRAPGKDESGDNGSGGGGTRPSTPPPPDRSADPDSDNPAPPPDTGDGPDSPEPEEPPPPNGPYQVTLETISFTSGSAPCIEVPGPRPTTTLIVDPGPATVQKIPTPGGGYTWQVFDFNGVSVTTILGSSFTSDCDSIVQITSQIPVPANP
jgi:hypothetical protein